MSVEALAQKFAESQKVKKQKPYQKVDHQFIKVISMILHYQKKELDLTITADQPVVRKFDINNHAAIRQSELKNFRISNMEELEMLKQKDTTKWPKYVVMNKIMRKIEQETRIQREDYDQLYEDKNGPKIDKIDETLFEKQQKLNQMNQEFERLKNRQF